MEIRAAGDRRAILLKSAAVRRMLVGCRAQFEGLTLRQKAGRNVASRIDRCSFRLSRRDDIRGFQVAVGAVSSAIMPAARASDDSAKAPELCRVACEPLWRPLRAGSPSIQSPKSRVDPDARFRRGVEEKFFQQFVAEINLPQVALFCTGSSAANGCTRCGGCGRRQPIADAGNRAGPFVGFSSHLARVRVGPRKESERVSRY